MEGGFRCVNAGGRVGLPGVAYEPLTIGDSFARVMLAKRVITAREEQHCFWGRQSTRMDSDRGVHGSYVAGVAEIGYSSEPSGTMG